MIAAVQTANWGGSECVHDDIFSQQTALYMSRCSQNMQLTLHELLHDINADAVPRAL